MNTKTDKRCKNKHPIGDLKLVILGSAVVVCDNCGHRHLFSSIPAVYAKDVYNSQKERFHVYVFSNLLICQGCHNWMTSIKIKCEPLENHLESWNNEIKMRMKA